MKKLAALLLALCLLLISVSAFASTANEAMLVSLQKAWNPSLTTVGDMTLSVPLENILNLCSKLYPSALDESAVQLLNEQYAPALNALLAHTRFEVREVAGKAVDIRILLDDTSLFDVTLYGDFLNLTAGNTVYVTSSLIPSTAILVDTSLYSNISMAGATEFTQEFMSLLSANPDLNPMREILVNAYDYVSALLGEAESLTLTGAEFAALDAQVTEDHHLLFQPDSALKQMFDLLIDYLYDVQYAQYANTYSTYADWDAEQVKAKLEASKPDLSTVKLSDMLSAQNDDQITITRSEDGVVISYQYDGTYWDENYNSYTVPSEEKLTFKSDYFSMSATGASAVMMTLDARTEGTDALRFVTSDLYIWINKTDTADGGRVDGKLSADYNGMPLEATFGGRVYLNGERNLWMKLALNEQEMLSAAFAQSFTDEAMPELDLAKYQVVTMDADGTISDADNEALTNDVMIGAQQLVNNLLNNLPEGAENFASLLGMLMGQAAAQ